MRIYNIQLINTQFDENCNLHTTHPFMQAVYKHNHVNIRVIYVNMQHIYATCYLV